MEITYSSLENPKYKIEDFRKIASRIFHDATYYTHTNLYVFTFNGPMCISNSIFRNRGNTMAVSVYILLNSLK